MVFGFFIRSMHCLVTKSVSHSLALLNFVEIVEFVKIYMDFLKSLNGFSCYTNLSKVLQRFATRFLHGVILFFSRPLPNKTKLKFDQDSKLVEPFALK